MALKLLHPPLASAPDSVHRLSWEVQVLKQLRHPGINQLLGGGEDDGTPTWSWSFCTASP